MFKLRTMRLGADKEKDKYLNLNEADGPVFKIKDDPRFTKVGKIFAHTGIDELPQLINVLRGEMSLVGPRPLPVEEEKKIPPSWRETRRSVKPGIISSWAVGGAHRLRFNQWMELDIKDIRNKSLIYDAIIIVKGLRLLIANVSNIVFNHCRRLCSF